MLLLPPKLEVNAADPTLLCRVARQELGAQSQAGC
jgi:hypothetical protein